MNALRNRQYDGESGFTLIELLVVILIIGILAAIAIPSFLNQRQKGQDACAKAMARNMQTAMETYNTDKSTYSGATPTALNTIDPTIPPIGGQPCGATWDQVWTGDQSVGTFCNGNAPADKAYCIFVPSPTNGFRIYKSATGVISRTCATPNQGACPASGTW
jgi:type IV pilus assembly protein PilA